MDPNALLDKVRSEDRTVLTEYESKQLLAAYGVPVVEEAMVLSVEEAVERAENFGFPVVIKGLGSKLTHKSERGLVRIGLTSKDEVRRAALEIEKAAGRDLEGWLVQPQLPGRREFVAGLFQDPQFGPVIMFGLGGVLTEALGDVVFRLAPLSEAWAHNMIGELKASVLLGHFRGEQAVNRARLVQTLTGLSRLIKAHPEVAEVDVNPLMALPDGSIKAVDALVVLGEEGETSVFRRPVDLSIVNTIFHPKSVAFVGASAHFRKWGQLLFTNVLAGGFEGDVYLVNPHAETIAGRPVYKSVKDIPGPVDLAVVTVPAASIMSLLPQFQAKGIKGVIMITSGFAETGPQGKYLEQNLVSEARERGLVILGPNTMGVCNPHHKFHCLGNHVRPKPGGTAFVSQSGNMGVQLLNFAEKQGVGIRAFAGSGNEAMWTIEDALDAFTVDTLTNTVLLYIESVKNGRRFFESARNVSHIKPIVVLKGGRTQAGKKAAASHTGAMASNTKVFDAACRQAGIVLASQPMDLLGLSAAFSSLPLPKGNRTAIMTLGGGWGVVTSDLCHQFGLQLPDLSKKLIENIDKILPPYWSRSNPVDLVGINDVNVPVKVIKELMEWDGCDAVLNLGVMGRKWSYKSIIDSTLSTDPDADRERLARMMEEIIQFEDQYARLLVELMEQYQKPILGVSLATGGEDRTVHDVGSEKYKGIFFPSPERAVKVLAEMCEYRKWLEIERNSKIEE